MNNITSVFLRQNFKNDCERVVIKPLNSRVNQNGVSSHGVNIMVEQISDENTENYQFGIILMCPRILAANGKRNVW